MTGGTPHDETETTQWAICPKIHGTSDWDHDCLDLAHGLMRSYASWIRVWAFTPPKLHVFKSYCSHLWKFWSHLIDPVWGAQFFTHGLFLLPKPPVRVVVAIIPKSNVPCHQFLAPRHHMKVSAQHQVSLRIPALRRFHALQHVSCIAWWWPKGNSSHVHRFSLTKQYKKIVLLLFPEASVRLSNAPWQNNLFFKENFGPTRHFDPHFWHRNNPSPCPVDTIGFLLSKLLKTPSRLSKIQVPPIPPSNDCSNNGLQPITAWFKT